MPTRKRNGDDLPKDGVLRPKHERFVLEYLKDLNASAAARRAGYSVRNSNVVGSRLLANVHISAAIERAKAERLERVRIDGDKVLRGFACLAFSDPGDYLTWGPDGARLKPSEDLTQDQRMAVSEVSEIVTDHGSNVRIKFGDRKGALDSLSRHLGLFEAGGIDPACVRAVMDGVLKVLEHRVPPADLEAALVELRQVALLAGPTEEGSE